MVSLVYHPLQGPIVTDLFPGSMMNGLQTLPQWKEYFDNPSGAMLGAMNAVYPAGKIVALFLVTYLSDRYGRNKVMAIGAFFCLIVPFMQAFAPNAGTFIASRALIGFFTTFLSQPSPILITETAYPTHRGKLTALYNTSFVSNYALKTLDARTWLTDMGFLSTWVVSLQPGAHSQRSRFRMRGAGRFLLLSRA